MSLLRRKEQVAALLLAILLLLPTFAFAEEASTKLDAISNVYPGDNIVIRGTTQLPEVIIRIIRPNGTLLEMDLLSGEELAEGKTVTIPAGSAAGLYQVQAGSGQDVAEIGFRVQVKNSGGFTGPIATPGPTPSPSAAISVKGELLPSGAVAASVEADELEAAWEAAEDGKAIIVVEKNDQAQSYELKLPASAVIGKGPQFALQIEMELAVVTLPGDMLADLEPVSADSISLVIAKADTAALLAAESQAAVAGRPAVTISLLADGSFVDWSGGSARPQVLIPYAPGPEELKEADFIVIWQIRDDGTESPVPSGHYDAAAGGVVFSANSSGTYAVAFSQPVFADLSGYSWARQEIGALAARGIIAGTGPFQYSPSDHITRADFLLLLTRTLELNAEFTENFADVQPTDYYYQALGTAKALGISQGAADNLFLPRQEISRQDMMTLTARALELAGKMALADSDDEALRVFADVDRIAPYARESVAALMNNGIIKGDGDYIHPLEQTTRAETAVMMYRIYNSLK